MSATPGKSAPRRRRRLLWNTVAVAVATAGIVAALALWVSSSGFENLVRRRLAAQLQNMTGGRVEIGSYHWRLMTLEAQASNVVIHGDESPNEAPYARIDSLRVRISILRMLSPRIELREVDVVHPQIHLIFYRDGATNQPHPALPSSSSRSGLDTLFRLHVKHVAVTGGVVDFDNRAAYLDFQNRYEPLDFRADDLLAGMKYVPAQGNAPEAYRLDVSVRDLNLARGGSLRGSVPPVHGEIQASLDLSRDSASLRSFTLTAAVPGAADRTLRVTGSLDHFSHPHWRAAVNGDLDLRLLNPILGYPFAPEGLARLNLDCGGIGGQFHIDGTVNAEKASYIGPGVVARGIELSSRVHADQDALRITSIDARLAPGGNITGEVLLEHWLMPTPGLVLEPAPAESISTIAPMRKKTGSRARSEAPPQSHSQAPPHSALLKQIFPTIPVNGIVHADLHNVSVDTVLDIVGQPPFQRLGVDALLNGPAAANWIHGDVRTLSVAATLGLAPSGMSIPGEAPATGAIDATYIQKDGSVDVRTLNVNMPASHLTARGHLGAYPLTSPTALNVDLHTGNLSEFDTVLRNLGLERNGRSGTAALPVSLSGQADFHGTWAGSLLSPHLSGTLNATEVGLELPASFSGKDGPPQGVHWDSITANGSYSAERISIQRGQLRLGSAQLLVDGSLAAAPVQAENPSALHNSAQPSFDSNSVLHLHVRAAKLNIADALPLAGLDFPVTGSLDAQITADGPVRAIAGSGWAQLNDAVLYGQPVSSLRAQGAVTGPAVKLTSIALHAPAGTVTGSGSYDLHSHRLQADASASGIDLAKIERLGASGTDVAGKLGLRITLSGTREDPIIEGHADVAGFAVADEPMGTLEAAAHTANHTLVYDLGTELKSARLSVHGQTELRGDFNTQANVDIAQFDMATLLRLAHVDSTAAQSTLSGTAVVSGPLARPLEMRGDLRLQQVALTVAGVHLKSEGGVHAALDNARLDLDPLHVTGDDTDLRVSGTLGLRDTQRLDLAASGSVNLKLAQTLDSDVTAGGTATFQVEAHGPLRNPGLRGRVEFQNGSMALEDVPNGISQLHGVLEFNQNRLEVRSLTAMTGGGQLSLGGYLTYQHGIYADLTVTGKSIRIRYPQGVSSEADTTLQFTGTQASFLLSGNVMVTRFTVSPDLDLAALGAQAAAVQPVASPNAPSNHVRLDVRIRSSPQLNFQNAYAKLAGDVDLRVRGTVASPSLLGRISVTEGSATIAGTRYDLQRGDITFTNPVRIQPIIDLTATARVEDYDITLGLHGTPENPSNMTFRSDPPLPEADVLALLALGRTQSEQGLYTEQQQQSVSLSPSTDVLLGGALNATVSSRVQKLFGAGSVKVDPSYLGALGNSTTRITVEEQVGPNVTLMYATNVDTTAQQLIQAEIAVNRHVSLVVARDESGVFSMVIRAIRRYK
ncbi:MAG TPA: translocation/assembly module TamB domain-containing protein [Terracidiphilus sp.]|jgi:translocation and assembly module TamB|nr:translocation/assembly module TamB domain-containing protein [Terracidiphilus sp.]